MKLQEGAKIAWDTTKRVAGAGAVFVMANFWSSGYRNIKTTLSNLKPDINKEFRITPDSLINITKEAQSAFKNVTFIYGLRGVETVESDLHNNLSEKDKSFIKEEMLNSEILDYTATSTGLRAAAIKDMRTNKISIAIAGADFSQKDQSMRADMDDIFASTKGTLGNQFDDLHKFVKNVKEKFGEPDLIAGHSLGGQLAMYISPECKDAKVITFDCAGAQFANIDELSDFYTKQWGRAVSENDIKKMLEKVVRVKPGEDAYNTLGSAGLDLTMVDPEKDNYSALSNLKTFLKEQHIYDVAYFDKITDKDLKLYQTPEGKDGYPAGPAAITGVLLLVAAASLYSDAKKVGKVTGKWVKSLRESEIDEDQNKNNSMPPIPMG